MPNTKIQIEFDRKSNSPIYYTIEGKDRNWVFLTKSQIDERIKIIRKYPLNENTFFYIIPLIAIWFGALVFMLMAIVAPTHLNFSLPFGDAIIFALILILLALAVVTYVISFPSQSFSWGDYKQSLDKKQKVAKYILGSIITTMVLGVIVGVIANYITIRIGIGH